MICQVEFFEQIAPFAQHCGNFIDDCRTPDNIFVFRCQHTVQYMNIRFWNYATFVSIPKFKRWCRKDKKNQFFFLFHRPVNILTSFYIHNTNLYIHDWLSQNPQHPKSIDVVCPHSNYFWLLNRIKSRNNIKMIIQCRKLSKFYLKMKWNGWKKKQ